MKKILSKNHTASKTTCSNGPESTQPLSAASSQKTVTPPDEALVIRLNAMAREYPFCAWHKPANSQLL